MTRAVSPSAEAIVRFRSTPDRRHGLHFAVEPLPADLFIDVDPQLFSSALMNLLSNAIKFTRPAGQVVWRAHRTEELLVHGGDLRIADTPGTGCVFVVEVPLASDTVLAAP